MCKNNLLFFAHTNTILLNMTKHNAKYKIKNTFKTLSNVKKSSIQKKCTMGEYFNRNKINVKTMSYCELKIRAMTAKSNALKLSPTLSFYYDISNKSTPGYLMWWLVKYFPNNYTK